MSGIIIIPIYIIYIVIGFILFKLVLKLFNKRLNSIFILVIVIIFPFWDIFVANGILKILTYTTKPIIYEMPERDKDGKIESIGESLTFTIQKETLDNKEELKKLLKKRYPNINEKVKYFVEFKTNLWIKNKLKKTVIAKIYLNSKKDYEIIEKSEARYISKLIDSDDTTLLGFKLFKSHVEFIDIKKNKIIAIAPSIRLGTPHIMNIFRGGILMLISGGGGAPMFRTKSIITFKDCKKQLFNIKGL